MGSNVFCVKPTRLQALRISGLPAPDPKWPKILGGHGFYVTGASGEGCIKYPDFSASILISFIHFCTLCSGPERFRQRNA
jgi:hypothetical protein